MNLLFDESFEKSIRKLQDANIKKRLGKLIESFEKATLIADISGIKKMQGFKHYYRARIGDYRVGLELINTTSIVFIIIEHRKDIYKNFP